MPRRTNVVQLCLGPNWVDPVEKGLVNIDES
jgi:hypothetical protein